MNAFYLLFTLVSCSVLPSFCPKKYKVYSSKESQKFFVETVRENNQLFHLTQQIPDIVQYTQEHDYQELQKICSYIKTHPETVKYLDPVNFMDAKTAIFKDVDEIRKTKLKQTLSLAILYSCIVVPRVVMKAKNSESFLDTQAIIEGISLGLAMVVSFIVVHLFKTPVEKTSDSLYSLEKLKIRAQQPSVENKQTQQTTSNTILDQKESV